MELFTIPTFTYPFSSSINTNAQDAELHFLEWLNSFSLVNDSTIRKVLAIKLHLLAAYTYPTASITSLEIITDFLGWAFIYDDKSEDMAIQEKIDYLWQLNHRLIEILKGINPVKEDEPLTHALANIRQRVKRQCSVNCYNNFIQNVEGFIHGSAWESRNICARIKPTLNTYLKMRAYIGGGYPLLDLIELVEEMEFGSEFVNHPTIQALRLTTNNIVLWSNDIISCQKEYEAGQYHNCVIILHQTRNCTLAEAIQQVKEMHDAEVKSFCELVSQLPSFSLLVDAEMQRYIAGLQSWISGHRHWFFISERYKTVVTNYK
ncbi:terpene synthase family protein [Nostoc sp. PCC 7524]|uniref:terpene synthase family protein n=1 Tax=Nostoc sp. (strain ATCC 29411 / PCC 7524) TaxID=28072 RepID=UPI00029F41CA|nr:terpene synthase [Nostoc sp. PCC 7524]AFY49208.1 terpene synthase family protein [Nostoc sp. PCC 7524]